jgi:DNA recombination protein RmuC
MIYGILALSITMTIISFVILFAMIKLKDQSGKNRHSEEIKEYLLKLQSSQREDFRLNREENANLAKDGRQELRDIIREFGDHQGKTLESVSEALQKKIAEWEHAVEKSGKLQKEELERFRQEQRTKLEEVKNSMEESARDTERQLEKAINELVKKVTNLAEQGASSSEKARGVLVSSLESFTKSVEKDMRHFKELQDKNFKQLSDTQFSFTATTDKGLKEIQASVEEKMVKLTRQISDDGKNAREELSKSSQQYRNDLLKSMEEFGKLQKERFGMLEVKQHELTTKTEQRLDSIRMTVEEKLDKTLGDRLGQSFETVGKQLLEVQRGLGEMQTLAQDVGGLKNVLSNVKLRGNIGELQLSMLLEQILSADQFSPNVVTKEGTTEKVEFAIKLPGHTDGNNPVWLPVDAKFPKEVYEQLQTAYEGGKPDEISLAQNKLEATIKKMAKDISEKYINPPVTTDFAIMFLPFEGIYGEVVRKSSLLEDIRRQHKILITGPSTLAAILNSLQMGFKTLAIQKRSAEVWQVLRAVKTEFAAFAGIINKAYTNISSGLTDLDKAVGTRTRAMERKLRSIEALDDESAKKMFDKYSDEDAA